MDDDLVAANLLTVIIAATLTLANRQRRHGRRPRSVWVSRLLSQRDTRGVWHNIIPHLETVTGSRVRGTFSNYFRMDEACFQELLTRVSPLIRRTDTVMRPAILPQQRLAVTLRYLATGCSFTDLYYNFRISVSALSSIIPETCQAIYTTLKNDELTTPTSTQRWRAITNDLYTKWQFPNCIGALDGKHIVLQKPWHAGSLYHNYKGTESIVLMAMCDANYR